MSECKLIPAGHKVCNQLYISRMVITRVILILTLLSGITNRSPGQAAQSWVYECRYLCSPECRGKMFMEGVDIKCACDDCQPMLTYYEASRMAAIFAGKKAQEEVQKAGQYFYHYADELNSFIARHWPNNGYQITRVEYHKTDELRYVKYFLESLDGQKTAVAFMEDKKSHHYQVRCKQKCAYGPVLTGVDLRPQEYCTHKDCQPLSEKILQQQN